jgi:hypothetical protein
MSHRDLMPLLDNDMTIEVAAPSGKRYQIETSVFWDDKKRSNLRIVVSIDDGGWRSFVPVTYGFIKAPDDSFVDE